MTTTKISDYKFLTNIRSILILGSLKALVKPLALSKVIRNEFLTQARVRVGKTGLEMKGQ
jgi:hypothetical protein